jgi:hypothetical protein
MSCYCLSCKYKINYGDLPLWSGIHGAQNCGCIRCKYFLNRENKNYDDFYNTTANKSASVRDGMWHTQNCSCLCCVRFTNEFKKV